MWERFGANLGQQNPAPRSGIGKYKLWIILGVVALVGIMTFQIISGLSSPSSTPSGITDGNGTVTTDSSDFLAQGYDDLDNSDNRSSTGSFWGLWGGIIIPLLIVIACVYIVLRGLKYVNSRVAASTSPTKHLESLDVLPLSQSGSIHLVRIGPRVIAVGASGQQVSLLAEMEAAQAEEMIAAHREQAAQGVTARQHMLEPFRELLQKRIGTSDDPAVALAEAESEPTDDHQIAVTLPEEPAAVDVPPAERLEELLDRLRPVQQAAGDNPIAWSDATQPFEVVSEVPAQPRQRDEQ